MEKAHCGFQDKKSIHDSITDVTTFICNTLDEINKNIGIFPHLLKDFTRLNKIYF